jgi:hypothetical protein
LPALFRQPITFALQRCRWRIGCAARIFRPMEAAHAHEMLVIGPQ